MSLSPQKSTQSQVIWVPKLTPYCPGRYNQGRGWALPSASRSERGAYNKNVT